jgi:hypothetical protein
LNLTNTTANISWHVSGATNDFDGGYDGESFDGEFVDFTK